MYTSAEDLEAQRNDSKYFTYVNTSVLDLETVQASLDRDGDVLRSGDIPSSLSGLSTDELRAITLLKPLANREDVPYPEEWDPDSPDDFSLTEEQRDSPGRWLAAIRGEASMVNLRLAGDDEWITNSADGTWMIVAVNVDKGLLVSLPVIDTESLMGAKELAPFYSPDLVNQVVPPSLRGFTRFNLVPYQPRRGVTPVIPLPMQKHYLSELRKLETDAVPRGLLIQGPAGSSKSTMTAAYLKDIITKRCVDSRLRLAHCSRATNVHRIKLSTWFKQNHAYALRERGDASLVRPLDAETIDAISSESPWVPVLHIEEMDKIGSLTDTRAADLHTLIDSVYEQRGLIIVTTNSTRDELKRLLKPETLRRITGDADDSTDFHRWDFYADLAKR